MAQGEAEGLRIAFDLELVEGVVHDLGAGVSIVKAQARVPGEQRQVVSDRVLAQPFGDIDRAREPIVVAEQIGEGSHGASAPGADGGVAVVVGHQAERVGAALLDADHQHAVPPTLARDQPRPDPIDVGVLLEAPQLPLEVHDVDRCAGGAQQPAAEVAGPEPAGALHPYLGEPALHDLEDHHAVAHRLVRNDCARGQIAGRDVELGDGLAGLKQLLGVDLAAHKGSGGLAQLLLAEDAAALDPELAHEDAQARAEPLRVFGVGCDGGQVERGGRRSLLGQELLAGERAIARADLLGRGRRRDDHRHQHHRAPPAAATGSRHTRLRVGPTRGALYAAESNGMGGLSQGE